MVARVSLLLSVVAGVNMQSVVAVGNLHLAGPQVPTLPCDEKPVNLFISSIAFSETRESYLRHQVCLF